MAFFYDFFYLDYTFLWILIWLITIDEWIFKRQAQIRINSDGLEEFHHIAVLYSLAGVSLPFNSRVYHVPCRQHSVSSLTVSWWTILIILENVNWISGIDITIKQIKNKLLWRLPLWSVADSELIMQGARVQPLIRSHMPPLRSSAAKLINIYLKN